MSPVLFNASAYKQFDIDVEPIRRLRRCTKCLLPETMPFIEFDSHGVCNYCNTYKKQEYLGEDKLRQWAGSLKSKNKTPDSVAAFSVGRDSCFGLHYFVKELGLAPVAFCYDWGIITDIAVRNRKRVCKALGVKVVVKKADIAKKRLYIKKNIAAWLKKPNLGMIPLFMAGDKPYFYYADKVRRHFGLEHILMTMNPFEKTYFKYGFCGVRPPVLKGTAKGLEAEQLRFGDVAAMGRHYLRQYITNPGYINSSLLDTVGATVSAYGIPHSYMRLFNYIPWNEDEVDKLLFDEYGWEKSPDCSTTWRIGDGTAPFYNYIYYLVAGFTENDCLRSNQIREGMLDRDEALKRVYEDNRPRFKSMKWYFDTIGMDMRDVLNRVKQIPRLY